MKADGVEAGLAVLFRDGALAGLSDARLVERLGASGDSAAFSALVGRHGPAVWSVCRRTLRDSNDAEDAFQATFLVLLRRAGSIRSPDRLAGWLHGVACKVARRARRDAARRPLVGGINGAEACSGDIVEDLARVERAAVLHEELAALPTKYRDPLLLCHLEGCSHDEAAARLGWPVGTVRGRLFRGRERLRQRMLRRGFEPSVMVPLFARELVVTRPRASIVETTMRVVPRNAVSMDGTGLIRERVIHWSEEVIRMLILAKWKSVMLATASVLLIGTGAGALALGAGNGPRGEPVPATTTSTTPPATLDPVPPSAAEEPSIPEIQRQIERLQTMLSRAARLQEDRARAEELARKQADEARAREEEGRRQAKVRAEEEALVRGLVEELSSRDAELELLKLQVNRLMNEYNNALLKLGAARSEIFESRVRLGQPENPSLKEVAKRYEEHVERLQEEFVGARVRLARLEMNIALMRAKVRELTGAEFSNESSSVDRRLSAIEAALKKLGTR